MNTELINYMSTLNLNEICRTCLSDHDEMTSLFAELELSNTDEDSCSFVYELLMNVTSIQVMADDGLPTLMCKNCIENVNNAFKFKLLCERSNALLQTYFAQTAIKNEMVAESDEEKESAVKTLEFENSTDVIALRNSDENIYEADGVAITIVESEESHPIIESLLLEEKSEETHVTNDNEENQDPQISVFIDEDGETEGEEISVKEEHIYDSITTEVENNCYKDEVSESEENSPLCPRTEYTSGKKRSYHNSYYSKRLNEQGERVYKCTFCGKEYRHSASLIVHIRTHTSERPYLCNICGKSFKQFTSLNYHKRSHTGERPYKCSLCDKRYRQSSSLTAHLRVHTGQRPFLCSVCGKGFRQAPDLNYHMRTHTKEKPYMCSVCGKRMAMQCHLVQHMRTHTGEKPYACSRCEKAFASSTRLKRHEIIHTGEKPYMCEICHKAFNRASTLRVHAMTHTDERPHQCQICGKGFIQAHCLRTHVKVHL